MKNKIIMSIVVLAVITLISGVTILAFASGGSQDDPFVTLSYLTNTFRPKVMEEVEKAEQDATARFDRRISELENQLGGATGGTGQPSSGSVNTFHVVTLTRGQRLVCHAGTEVMLRIGTAEALGASEPAMVDYTDGMTLAAGSSLKTNHMYLVTIASNGLTATADNVRVLVRGEYSVR